MKRKIHDVIKEKLTGIIRENGLESEEIVVRASPLPPEEAIGNPEDKDYPLIVGRERMMQAEFRGSLGQAFTDMYGNFSGRLSDVLAMDLENNRQRAIFISTLNAVMRYLGMVTKTIHCKDSEPPECSRELVKYVQREYGNPRIAFIGFQPRMVEALSSRFELRVTDLDKSNIGQERFGVIIDGPEKTPQNLDWCELALVTGTTVVNDTIQQFMVSKPAVYYGVTISGVARLLGLNHFCHFGH